MRPKEISFSQRSWEDFKWLMKNDIKLLKKLVEVIDSIKINPFEGIGKPELLKGNYKGLWSRRINDEHRILYKVEEDNIIIFQVKGHYLDK
jgi:toxin YoeB